MQLFYISSNNVNIKWDTLEVFSVPELISQLRKVLRVKQWDKICIQYSEISQTTRYELSVIDWTDKDLIGEIISNQTFPFPKNNISMLIAMPNKREKAELIIQKLTEIWVQNIYFWASEHSIIRQRNEKKAERLEKISQEAVEQSRWIQIPKIKFLNSDELKAFIVWKNLILANQWWLSYQNLKSKWEDFCWIIWPEWWFSGNDLLMFNNANIIDLWNNVLRMETASIVLAWILKNVVTI